MSEPDLQELHAVRREAVRRFINQGLDLEEVRMAAGVSLRTMLTWCYAYDGSPLVGRDVLERLSHEVETVTRQREAVANRRRAKRGGNLSSQDEAYRALAEEVRFLKREYESMAGEAYEPGYDHELDEKVARLKYWYGNE